MPFLIRYYSLPSFPRLSAANPTAFRAARWRGAQIVTTKLAQPAALSPAPSRPPEPVRLRKARPLQHRADNNMRRRDQHTRADRQAKDNDRGPASGEIGQHDSPG